MELGLERVEQVYQRLDRPSPGRQIVTIAGTNGKGSTVAYMEAIASAAGLSTGAYTSPHLLRYNERLRIAGIDVSDQDLVAGFKRVEAVRRDIPLTYFEFGTLAVFVIMADANVDLALLEVGLGGRLDAVNVVDADIAVITSIGLDHTDWLGDDLESIGAEKAGIFRYAKVAVCGERMVPDSIACEARRLACRYLQIDVDYAWRDSDQGLLVVVDDQTFKVPDPPLPGRVHKDNLATALTAMLSLSQPVLPGYDQLQDALARAPLAGRLQKIGSCPDLWLDVAHNAPAARNLAACLLETPCRGKRIAVCGMLADKDAAAVIGYLAGLVERWILVSLDGPRGQSANALFQKTVDQVPALKADLADSVEQGLDAAFAIAGKDDLIIVFGSFHTVEQALLYRKR